MRVIEINGGVYGSTGKIMFQIAALARNQGYEVRCYSPVTQRKQNKDLSLEYKTIGTYLSRKINAALDRLFGCQDGFAFLATNSLIREIKKYKPDLIHIHTLHGSFININSLLRFFSEQNYKVIWTFHDCWPFTGHCTYFSAFGCDKWLTGCHNCQHIDSYPKNICNKSHSEFNKKIKLINSISNLTIVTPSKWLADLVKMSKLSCHEVITINNGINLDIFSYQKASNILGSDFGGKALVLAVSFVWNYTKGFDYLLEIDKKLFNTNKMLVVVGVTEEQKKFFSSNCILITRTNNQKELAEIYSRADVMINPTREDNYPTVDLECISCGTPVVAFDSCGTAETIPFGCGHVVKTGDVEEMLTKVDGVLQNPEYYKKNCINARERFSSNLNFERYINLYHRVLEEN